MSVDAEIVFDFKLKMH